MIELNVSQELATKAAAAAKDKGIDLPEWMKRQLANQVHVELLGQMSLALAERFGDEVWEICERVSTDIGRELAPAVRALLDLDPDDARSLTKAVDLTNLMLDISGEEVVFERGQVVRHERDCLLSKRLVEIGCPQYCSGMFQPMYRGLLKTLNAKADANDPPFLKSKGDDYCEVITMVKE
ncbi:MAG: hypothetical protein E3J29_06140 [Dehalococcoidia bacterium]|nr:MAG: hypothetical protein E3J29_06140 [Dehalococcoidia bacterium]